MRTVRVTSRVVTQRPDPLCDSATISAASAEPRRKAPRPPRPPVAGSAARASTLICQRSWMSVRSMISSRQPSGVISQCRRRLRGRLGLALQVRMTRTAGADASGRHRPRCRRRACGLCRGRKGEAAAREQLARVPRRASSATMAARNSPTSCASPTDISRARPARAISARSSAWVARQPARRPRPAAGRRSRARHSAECADHARAGGPAPPPSVDRRPGPQRCSRYGMFAQL